MPILDARHDLGHPVEGDTAWSESYYFNGFDPGSDSGLFTRIGIRPNEGTMDVGLSVWLPGGDLAEYRAVVEQHEMVDTDLQVGAVRYRMVDPMRSWHLTFDADVPVRTCTRGSTRDHECPRPARPPLRSLTPPIGTDGQARPARTAESADAAGTTGKGHFEQAGTWTGGSRSTACAYDWDGALGNRDRSWGPRTGAGRRCGAGSASTSTSASTSAASGSAPVRAICTGDGSPTTAG